MTTINNDAVRNLERTMEREVSDIKKLKEDLRKEEAEREKAQREVLRHDEKIREISGAIATKEAHKGQIDRQIRDMEEAIKRANETAKSAMKDLKL